MKYIGVHATSTATGEFKWTYKPLDLYDVDYTGSGHQPYHYDAMAQIFDRCTVTKVHLEVEARNTSALPLVLLISPLSGLVPKTGYINIREIPHTK
jgi:hypothetical protein